MNSPREAEGERPAAQHQAFPATPADLGVTWSLRGRLLALLLTAAFIAWALSAIWLLQRAQQAADGLFDAALAETAHLVLALVAHESSEEDERGDPDAELSELPFIAPAHAERMFFQVRDAVGRIALVSPGAPTVPLADANERGYADHSIDGARWRVFSLHDSRAGFTIHVGEPALAREAFTHAALWQLAPPGLLLLVALAAATIALTRRLLRPVEQAARDVAAAAPGDPLAFDMAALPREMQPLARAIDTLQQRVQRALLHERTLTADAAHELRTPLAALRAQAQWAQRAGDDAERDAALAGVIAAADRCASLAEATLTLARLDAAAIVDTGGLPPVDLAQVAGWVMSDLDSAARARGLQIEAHIAEPAVLPGDADALAILLRNLLDNAIRHAHARIALRVQPTDGAMRLSVRDDGDGVAPEDRDRLFDRFWRGAPRADGETSSDRIGSGLGLALVRRIVELHRATLAVTVGLGGRGLGIEVQFPKAEG